MGRHTSATRFGYWAIVLQICTCLLLSTSRSSSGTTRGGVDAFSVTTATMALKKKQISSGGALHRTSRGTAMSSSRPSILTLLLQKKTNSDEDEAGSNPPSPSSSSQQPPAAAAAAPSTFALFENLVHQVTGDDTYQFGDLTKQTLSDLTGKDITQGEGYEFGDITKNFASKTGQAVTGNADYEFGDITKSSLRQLEQDMQDWKFESLADLPNSIFQRTLGGMSPTQKKEIIVAFVRLGAIGVLAWGVVANICTAGVLSLAWIRTVISSSAATAVPIFPVFTKVEPVIWRAFLSRYTTLRIVLDPVLLVVKAAGTLALFLPYTRCIGQIEQRIPAPWRNRAPLIARGLALAAAFGINNLLISGAIGSVFLGVGGLGARLFCAL